MENLLTAIVTKISGSTLSNDVSGRIWLDKVPDDDQPVTYPYIIYFIVSDVPDWTFKESFEDILIQFSLFSASSGLTEITTMYNDLKALFDDCAMSITSDTLIWFRRENTTMMVDEILVGDATQSVRHWAVDYEIKIQS